MRRIKREGFLRKWLAPVLGYYPWRCSYCQKEQLLKSRGKKRSSEDASESSPETGGQSTGQTR
jgi:hypothetical protein